MIYCPRCGQERVAQETSYCSKCGFLLTAAAELLATGGVPPTAAAALPSDRSRGVKQGIFLLLIMFLVAVLVGLVSEFG